MRVAKTNHFRTYVCLLFIPEAVGKDRYYVGGSQPHWVRFLEGNGNVGWMLAQVVVEETVAAAATEVDMAFRREVRVRVGWGAGKWDHGGVCGVYRTFSSDSCRCPSYHLEQERVGSEIRFSFSSSCICSVSALRVFQNQGENDWGMLSWTRREGD